MLSKPCPWSGEVSNRDSERGSGSAQKGRDAIDERVRNELVETRVLGASGFIGVGQVADLDQRARDGIAYEHAERAGSGPTPHPADPRFECLVEAPPEKRGGPASAPRAGRLDGAPTIEHLETARGGVGARVGVQRDEQRGAFAREGEPSLDRDERVVAAR